MRAQREKGKRFERMIASLLRERFPDMNVRRGHQSHKASEPDVVIERSEGSGHLLWVECKSSKRPISAQSAIKQIRRDTGMDFVLPMKQDRKKIIWMTSIIPDYELESIAGKRPSYRGFRGLVTFTGCETTVFCTEDELEVFDLMEKELK